MFSTWYLFAAGKLLLKYPALIVSRKNKAEILYSKKQEEWEKKRELYATRPKKTLGFEIFLNTNDQGPISASIATRGWLSLSRVAILGKLLKKDMCFVDVGANLGFYTLLASRLVGTRGLVISLEPEDRNFTLLQKSVELNRFTNVKLRKEVLSGSEGTVQLHLAEAANPGAHSLVVDHGRKNSAVLSTTLDALAKAVPGRTFDFLKIHVGAEPFILDAGREVLARHKPIILMSFVPEVWRAHAALLDTLWKSYELLRVVDSPLLTKKVERSSLLSGSKQELLLLPKS